MSRIPPTTVALALSVLLFLVGGIIQPDFLNAAQAINIVRLAAFLGIIAAGREAGADSVILGCTEIGLLVNAENSPLPAYDTMALHAAAITDFILYGV